MRHPDIPPEIRGTYAGLAHEAAAGYLHDLGVTAVELLPVHEYVPDGADAPDEAADGTLLVDDDFLVLVNAWWEPVEFTVPEVRPVPQDWLTELDSYDPAVPAAAEQPRQAGDRVRVRPRSLLVLRSKAAGAATSVRQNRA